MKTSNGSRVCAAWNRRGFLLAAPLTLLTLQNANAQLAPAALIGAPHPDLELALTMIRSRRWAELSRMIHALPPQSARNLLDDVGDLLPFGTDFSGLAALPMGYTVIAAAQVGWAWRFRGRGVASTVTDKAYESFDAQLRLAKANVAQAVSADSNDGVARALGFQVHKGLSEKLELYQGLRGYLDSARRPVGGMSAFVDAVSGKWLGSDSEALTVARNCFMLDLPASAAIIAEAHHVCWTAAVMGHEEGDGPPPMFGEHIVKAGALGEVLAADDAFKSVGPDPDRFAMLHAHARLGFALVSLNEADRARPHITALGAHIEGPWTLFENPREVLAGVRRALGLEQL